jgi:hypothetical protein
MIVPRFPDALAGDEILVYADWLEETEGECLDRARLTDLASAWCVLARATHGGRFAVISGDGLHLEAVADSPGEALRMALTGEQQRLSATSATGAEKKQIPSDKH